MPKQFAQTGLAGTTLRAVASEADVDSTLVYPYFGVRQGLLDAATTPPSKWLENVAQTWTAPEGELGSALLRLMLASWADDEVGPVLRAVVQTAAHEPSTRETLRIIIERGERRSLPTRGRCSRMALQPSRCTALS